MHYMKMKDGTIFECGPLDLGPFTAQGCKQITDPAEIAKAQQAINEARVAARNAEKEASEKSPAEPADKPAPKKPKKEASEKAAE